MAINPQKQAAKDPLGTRPLLDPSILYLKSVMDGVIIWSFVECALNG